MDEGTSREDGGDSHKQPAAASDKVIIILDDSDSENDTPQPPALSSPTTNAPATPTSSATSTLHSLTISQPISPKKEHSNQNESATNPPLPTNLPPSNFVDPPDPVPLIPVPSHTNVYFAAAKNNFQSQFDPEIFDMQFTAQGRTIDKAKMQEILRGFKTKRKSKAAAKRHSKHIFIQHKVPLSGIFDVYPFVPRISHKKMKFFNYDEADLDDSSDSENENADSRGEENEDEEEDEDTEAEFQDFIDDAPIEGEEPILDPEFASWYSGWLVKEEQEKKQIPIQASQEQLARFAELSVKMSHGAISDDEWKEFYDLHKHYNLVKQEHRKVELEDNLLKICRISYNTDDAPEDYARAESVVRAQERTGPAQRHPIMRERAREKKRVRTEAGWYEPGSIVFVDETSRTQVKNSLTGGNPTTNAFFYPNTTYPTPTFPSPNFPNPTVPNTATPYPNPVIPNATFIPPPAPPARSAMSAFAHAAMQHATHAQATRPAAQAHEDEDGDVEIVEVRSDPSDTNRMYNNTNNNNIYPNNNNNNNIHSNNDVKFTNSTNENNTNINAQTDPNNTNKITTTSDNIDPNPNTDNTEMKTESNTNNNLTDNNNSNNNITDNLNTSKTNIGRRNFANRPPPTKVEWGGEID
eukprot:Phypoly_transcript_05014.p1 GENE.Phypoly_transcript_05014~~Phypoly_transcript_05014.p1  ORF type:complete len:666 (+),score=180.32 Phypoly_transcript_05014:85-1998(+)